jgi:hypothetical protein
MYVDQSYERTDSFLEEFDMQAGGGKNISNYNIYNLPQNSFKMPNPLLQTHGISSEPNTDRSSKTGSILGKADQEADKNE